MFIHVATECLEEFIIGYQKEDKETNNIDWREAPLMQESISS